MSARLKIDTSEGGNESGTYRLGGATHDKSMLDDRVVNKDPRSLDEQVDGSLQLDP